MVANRQERRCGRQHRARSRVDRSSGRTNGRGKRTKSGSNTSVVPVSYSCRTNIVLAVLDRQRSGAKATIWWFCYDHDRSGRSAMIGNIGKEWSAQCDLGLTRLLHEPDSYMVSILCTYLYTQTVSLAQLFPFSTLCMYTDLGSHGYFGVQRCWCYGFLCNCSWGECNRIPLMIIQQWFGAIWQQAIA